MLVRGRRLLTAGTQVRFLPPQLRKCGNQLEVIRLDEEPVSKTGAGHTVVGSSPTASALVNDVQNNMCLWPSGKGAGLPTRTGGFDSRGALLKWVGSSAAERVPVKHQRAGSSPARPSQKIAG